MLPPSIGRITPVTNDAESCARNTIAFAISDGSPTRPTEEKLNDFLQSDHSTEIQHLN